MMVLNSTSTRPWFCSCFSDDEGNDRPHTYVDMIRTALNKLPGRQGNLPTVCAYIEVRGANTAKSKLTPGTAANTVVAKCPLLSLRSSKWDSCPWLLRLRERERKVESFQHPAPRRLYHMVVSSFVSGVSTIYLVFVSQGVNRKQSSRDSTQPPELFKKCPTRYDLFLRYSSRRFNPPFRPVFFSALPFFFLRAQEHFHDRLNWRSESSLRRTPAWKASVRRTLGQHHAFCHAGTPEKNVFTIAD